MAAASTLALNCPISSQKHVAVSSSCQFGAMASMDTCKLAFSWSVTWANLLQTTVKHAAHRCCSRTHETGTSVSWASRGKLLLQIPHGAAVQPIMALKLASNTANNQQNKQATTSIREFLNAPGHA